MSSAEEISSMFDTESQKLENFINIVTSKSDLTLSDIIETYYQIMNVSSMISMLQEQLDSKKHQLLLKKISDTKQTITNQFNLDIHPKILDFLTNSIQETTKLLQSNSDKKSKEEIENKSAQYEELRKKMSTKEFVEQYGKGLS